jgi:mono/diheme cytochrome c family protein
MKLGLVVVPFVLSLAGGLAASAQTGDADLERRFTQTVRPFLTAYCAACHSGGAAAAGLDLKSYSTTASVIADFTRWNLAVGRLAAGEMPPKGAPQPPASDRESVIGWIRSVRAHEIRGNAGDPGRVPARRLSNAEYNYTIRDLTGVDLRPAREFPVDPANTEGFDNSGESLTMSPALVDKYLQAARMVADHMVLTPDGFDFAPHPMLVETDRDRYTIGRIIDFYQRQPTDYADYFQAAWRHKHRAALGRPRATLADAAADARVSARYLPMVWQILEEPTAPGRPEVGPVAKLQKMWRELPPPGAVQPAALRARCVEMRDFVRRIRLHTSMQFASPIVAGLPAGSQPLLNWKLRNFNLNRRRFDPEALRNDTDPPPGPIEIPRYPGLHRDAAPRWAALMAKARAGDPDLVVPAAERARYEASFARFASVFPDVFYVSERGRYFPDDSEDKGRFLSAGYHNAMGYWRDDVPLMELILDERGRERLDRLWLEFDFIARHTERTYDQFYFNQAGAVDGKGAESGRPRPLDKAITDPEVIFGLRDDYVAKALASPANDPIAPEAIRHHFHRINDTLRSLERMRSEAEPKHLETLLRFAARAYRRPLEPSEREGLTAFYRVVRERGGLSHEDAMRDAIVRVLMSPKFCYRVDLTDARAPAVATTAGGTASSPISPHALASRLSYFLWASMPDEELLSAAASGRLMKSEDLAAQARRMLRDPRARGLALEFGGAWLDFRRFEEHNAVDRERFPAFTNELRQAMFEEPVRALEDLIRNDRPVLDLLYGGYTFVNPVLARHYGIPGIDGDADRWVRVDDARRWGRGGLLTMSAFLTQNSPGLRTSPVKRGYWVVRRVLGEVIPPPPPSVPELPEDEAKLDLPLREVLAKHRENPACAACHARFDSFGLAFESYGPVGELRTKDLAGRPVETRAEFPGGGQGDGYESVLAYVREHRQNDFTANLSRKLLAYALGRSLQLSDEPLVERMNAASAARGYRFVPLVEAIVTSRQFMYKRSVGLAD